MRLGAEPIGQSLGSRFQVSKPVLDQVQIHQTLMVLGG
jgi:hypothetical protein